MKNNTFAYACVTMACCGLFWTGTLLAQQAPNPLAKPRPPAAAQKPKPGAWPTKLKDGQPDVQGIWDPRIFMGCFAGVGPGCITDPADKQIPYQPWALARRNEVRAVSMKPSAALMDTRSRAWPDGVPRLTFYHEFQIMQAPGAVVILYEMQHEFRYIPLDNRPPLDPGIQLWMGSSRGHWEGTTLVIEVTNHSARNRLSLSGDFASEQLKVVERWNFVDANTLQYSATLSDPKVYTKPWSISYKIERSKDPTYEVMEYAGVEGERDAKIMLEQADQRKQPQDGQKKP